MQGSTYLNGAYDLSVQLFAHSIIPCIFVTTLYFSIFDNYIAFTVHRKSGLFCPSWMLGSTNNLTRLTKRKKNRGTNDREPMIDLNVRQLQFTDKKN